MQAPEETQIAVPEYRMPEYDPANAYMGTGVDAPVAQAPAARAMPVPGAAPMGPKAVYKGVQGPVGAMKLVNWRGRQIDESVMDKAEALARAFPGLRLTSAYRDPKRNAATPGASKTSWHMKGRAVDFGGSAKDQQAGAAWAKANGAREVLVHNAGTGQHLHAAF